MTNQHRVPAGSPEGGQFARGARAETSLTSLDQPLITHEELSEDAVLAHYLSILARREVTNEDLQRALDAEDLRVHGLAMKYAHSRDEAHAAQLADALQYHLPQPAPQYQERGPRHDQAVREIRALLERTMYADDTAIRLQRYLHHGGALRPSTIHEALRPDADDTEILNHVDRDILYTSEREGHIRDATSMTHAELSRPFRQEGVIPQPNSEDIQAVIRDPSPGLARAAAHPATVHLARQVYREARRRAAARRYGTADYTHLPASITQAPESAGRVRMWTEPIPGVLDSSSQGHHAVVLSDRRNAEMPSPRRTADGLYYGEVGRQAVMEAFRDEYRDQRPLTPVTSDSLKAYSEAAYRDALDAERSRINSLRPSLKSSIV